MRRPSRPLAASTAARTSARPPLGAAAALPTPVGARYSPNTSRIAAPHSPVVTPAFAAAIEGGMTFRPSRAAALTSASAAAAAAVVARRAPCLEPGDLVRLRLPGPRP